MSKSSANNHWKRIIMLIFSLSLLFPVLAACTAGNSGNDTETRVLRIAYMSGDSQYDDYMRTQYTDLFEFTHKNIDIELIPAVDWSKQRYQTREEGEPYREPNYLEEMKNLINGDNPPDLVLVGYDELSALIDENMLQPLESYIQADKFNLEGIVPAVINGLRAVGNNELYALAPTFSSSALLFNKGIFLERGVELPTDNMTWDDMFELARTVANGEGAERQYGFSFGRYYYDDLFWGLDTYIAPLELRILDEAAEELLVDNDSWENALKKLIDLRLDKIMPEPPTFDEGMPMPMPRAMSPFEGDAFLSGKLAMTITQYSQLNEIIAANENAANIEGFTPIDWDVVTLPTHLEAPDVGGFIHMDPIMGIAANAHNPEDAWEFLKFINSEDWAELKSRSMNMMVSREAMIKPHSGADYNISAFYQLTPTRSVINSYPPDMDPIIRNNLWQINSIGQNKVREMIEGEKGVREGLQEWATEGKSMLQQIRENPDGGFHPMF